MLLHEFLHVCTWIDRVRSQEGFLEQHYPYSIDPYSSGELP
jgi:glutathione S-transferase